MNDARQGYQIHKTHTNLKLQTKCICSMKCGREKKEKFERGKKQWNRLFNDCHCLWFSMNAKCVFEWANLTLQSIIFFSFLGGDQNFSRFNTHFLMLKRELEALLYKKSQRIIANKIDKGKNVRLKEALE